MDDLKCDNQPESTLCFESRGWMDLFGFSIDHGFVMVFDICQVSTLIIVKISIRIKMDLSLDELTSLRLKTVSLHEKLGRKLRVTQLTTNLYC